jgi:hypothetical protein
MVLGALVPTAVGHRTRAPAALTQKVYSLLLLNISAYGYCGKKTCSVGFSGLKILEK